MKILLMLSMSFSFNPKEMNMSMNVYMVMNDIQKSDDITSIAGKFLAVMTHRTNSNMFGMMRMMMNVISLFMVSFL